MKFLDTLSIINHDLIETTAKSKNLLQR